MHLCETTQRERERERERKSERLTEKKDRQEKKFQHLAGFKPMLVNWSTIALNAVL